MRKINFLARLFFILFYLSSAHIADSQMYTEQIYKFGKVLDWINKYYVDTVNQEKLIESAIIEVLKNLDPHSAYHTKKEVKEMNEPLQGNYEGIGISFNVLLDTILVISSISGGPSEKVGIQAGDRIVKIEGENVAGIGITTNKVKEKLLGKKGTKVSVSVKRRRVKELLEFTITRDKVPIFSLDAAYMVNNDIGYIKLNRFSFTTMKEFKKAMAKLREQNIRHLILDLRENRGGYLTEAVKLADQFLEDEKLIVYTEGLNSSRNENYATSAGEFEEKGKIVILINEGSASASEIVAGAIQDWDRGVIIGRRSFGKGLVQRPLNLPDGSMIRLTVARYYTPTGRLIQKPYDRGLKEYAKDMIYRNNHGEFSHRDSIHFSDSLKYFTLKNKRVVYGSGGIMPDIFVSIDTSWYSNYYRELISKGIFNRFILNYVDNNRETLNQKFPDFKQFNKEFMVSESILAELINFASSENLKKNDEEFNISRERIKILFKAYVSRDLWATSEFFEVINKRDTCFIKAIEVIENSAFYNKTILNR